MRDTLLRYLRIIPAADAEMMARDLGLSQCEVQDLLIQMDDAGDVIMKNGMYRLSEVSRLRAVKRLDDGTI